MKASHLHAFEKQERQEFLNASLMTRDCLTEARGVTFFLEFAQQKHCYVGIKTGIKSR